MNLDVLTRVRCGHLVATVRNDAPATGPMHSTAVVRTVSAIASTVGRGRRVRNLVNVTSMVLTVASIARVKMAENATNFLEIAGMRAPVLLLCLFTCSRGLFYSCPPGFRGDKCEERCPDNKYGLGCTSNCSCKNGGLCNGTDGSCTCIGHWVGLYCDRCECIKGGVWNLVKQILWCFSMFDGLALLEWI